MATSEWTHEDHAAYIGNTVSKKVQQKYARGQLEHGGQIWQKPRMLGHAIDEVLDLNVYLLVMRDQLRILADDLIDAGQPTFAGRVRAILGDEP